MWVFVHKLVSKRTNNSEKRYKEKQLSMYSTYYVQANTVNKKTMQHNVDDDILTKQCFPRAHR
jgi:hypothetical protein